MSEAQLIRQALDPRHSVVVEACAGSGKTWLLVSRILRLLLDDAAPGDILAITYTRKAAREIEERLSDWLRLLAVGSEHFPGAAYLSCGAAARAGAGLVTGAVVRPVWSMVAARLAEKFQPHSS